MPFAKDSLFYPAYFVDNVNCDIVQSCTANKCAVGLGFTLAPGSTQGNFPLLMQAGVVKAIQDFKWVCWMLGRGQPDMLCLRVYIANCVYHRNGPILAV